jgi:hypothetical protein
MAERVANDFATTLAVSLSSSANSVVLSAPPPSELVASGDTFRLRIEDAVSEQPAGTNVEFVTVTNVSGSTLTILRSSESSSRFPAVAHAQGSIVTHVLTAGALASLISTVGSGATQAELNAETTARQTADDALTAAVGAKADASALAGKQSTSEKGQQNGYAPLNASSRVPIGNLGAGTPDGTKFLRDDGTLATPPGAVGSQQGTSFGTTALNGSGEPEITFTSAWGIDASTGEPYFDPAGAVAGEDALLMADQTSGDLFLIQPTGATP